MLVLQKREKEGLKMLKNQIAAGGFYTWEKIPRLSGKYAGTFFCGANAL